MQRASAAASPNRSASQATVRPSPREQHERSSRLFESLASAEVRENLSARDLARPRWPAIPHCRKPALICEGDAGNSPRIQNAIGVDEALVEPIVRFALSIHLATFTAPAEAHDISASV
ncbi:hypothetical protein Pelo_19325 [Pelomyxa schiedti]|nr:hypothetical protein Pelo_19325 [Pelomyxa schiedti]